MSSALFGPDGTQLPEPLAVLPDALVGPAAGAGPGTPLPDPPPGTAPASFAAPAAAYPEDRDSRVFAQDLPDPAWDTVPTLLPDLGALRRAISDAVGDVAPEALRTPPEGFPALPPAALPPPSLPPPPAGRSGYRAPGPGYPAGR
ncbi:MAG TPA: hypothetical protein VGD67_07515, partial [Pseudonocardiaceae bacterium]